MGARKTRRHRKQEGAETQPPAPVVESRADPRGAAERYLPAWVWMLPSLVLGALVYARTVAFGFSFLDDAFLTEKQSLTNLGGVGRAFETVYVLGTYYRPLVTASYVLDSKWSGSNAASYHATNVLLHLATIALVYVLLIRLRFPRWISAFTSSAFAIHPALVEAVAWIPGRNDSLFTVFALGSWIFLTFDIERESPSFSSPASLRSGLRQPPGVSSAPSLRSGLRPNLLRLGHVAGLLAALFTKETALVLPLLFAVYVWSTGLASSWLRTKRLWPWWVLDLAGYAAARAAVGAPHEVSGKTASTLLANVPVLLAGLGKLCLPLQLSPLATARDAAVWPGFIAIAAIAAAVVAIRPLRRNVLFLAASTFLLPLLPTLFVAERLTLENRLYLPAVGLCIFLAELAAASSPGRRPLLAAVGACVLAAFVPVTWTYVSAFQDRQTLARAAVDSSPSSALAHLQRGDAYYTIQHDLDQAEGEYRQAIDIDSRELVVHNNLAVVLMARSRFSEAEVELRKELEMNARYAAAHYNLGIVLRKTGRPDDAAIEWERALQSEPNHVNAMGELLVYHSARGEQAKADYYRDQMSKRGMTFVAPLSGQGR